MSADQYVWQRCVNADSSRCMSWPGCYCGPGGDMQRSKLRGGASPLGQRWVTAPGFVVGPPEDVSAPIINDGSAVGWVQRGR